MENLYKMKELLKQELDGYCKRGELSAGSLDVIHKITDTIKNIDKIEMLEGGGEYSRGGGRPILYDSETVTVRAPERTMSPGTIAATTETDIRGMTDATP